MKQEEIPIPGHMPDSSPIKSLLAGDFTLREIHSEFGKGLDIVTKAIYYANVKLTEPGNIAASLKTYTGQDFDLNKLTIREQNVRLAALVRSVGSAFGWVEGWTCLVQAAPQIGLHPLVVKDVKMGAKVYARLRPGRRMRPVIDVEIGIGPDATNEQLSVVGPKSLGGTAWKQSKEYAAVLARPQWRDSGYTKGFSPCVAYGWIAVQIKVIPHEDSEDAMRLQLLSLVEYDFDYTDDNDLGFKNGFRMAAEHVLKIGTKLQAAAFTGMISYDFQTFVRHIQQGWVGEGKFAYNMGPEDASPEEWAAILLADCAALVPFAFETAEQYNTSRVGMIVGAIQANCNDLLFDTGCSSRVNSVQYTEAAGVGKYGIAPAFAIGFFEEIAKFFLKSLLTDGEGARPPYGYATCMIIGPWGSFNTRYRCWERSVKYLRQLQRSSSPEAQAILYLTYGDFVLKDCNLSMDAGKSWARAISSDASALVPRDTTKYFIPSRIPELFTMPGVDKPNLCENCTPLFNEMMSDLKKEEVHAIAGLPDSVTLCRPAGLAAGIRRAVLWATTDACCDSCSARVGTWCDAVSYGVLSALMHDEPTMGPSTWSLQNYMVGAITFWPLQILFLLSTFDLVAKMKFEDGAMGHRDIVDCN